MPDLGLIPASSFYGLTALIALAALVCFAGLLLRQPMFVSFIAVGMSAGPSALGVVQPHEHLELPAAPRAWQTVRIPIPLRSLSDDRHGTLGPDRVSRLSRTRLNQPKSVGAQ